MRGQFRTAFSADWTRGSTLMLLIIIALAAMLRIYLFRGFMGLDDAEYARFAYQVGHGSFVRGAYDGPAVFPLRVGVFLPVAPLFRAFGVSEWTMVAYPFVISLLGIGLVAVCSTLFFGRSAGLVAAMVLAVFPWDVELSTKLLADLPAAFYAALAVTALVAGESRGPSRTGLVALGLFAGLALGISWLSKESVAYLAPFCVALMALTILRRGRPMLFLWAGVAVGSLAILAGEMLTYYSQTGDLLFRFHEIERSYGQTAKYFFTEGSAFGWQKGEDYRQILANRLLVRGPSTILLNESFFYLPLIALGATVYAWVRRDGAFLIPALWLWTVALMFNFGSSSTKAYTPLALYNSYLYPIFYPAIILTSGFLVAVSRERSAFRWVGAMVAVSLLWIAGTQTALAIKYPSNWLSGIRGVRHLVAADTTLYSDTLSLKALEFFCAYPAKTAWVNFEDVDGAAEVPNGSLVLINPPHIGWLDRHGGIWDARKSGYRQHDFYTNPPRGWIPVQREHEVSVYRAGSPIKVTALRETP